MPPGAVLRKWLSKGRLLGRGRLHRHHRRRQHRISPMCRASSDHSRSASTAIAKATRPRGARAQSGRRRRGPPTQRAPNSSRGCFPGCASARSPLPLRPAPPHAPAAVALAVPIGDASRGGKERLNPDRIVAGVVDQPRVARGGELEGTFQQVRDIALPIEHARDRRRRDAAPPSAAQPNARVAARGLR